MKVSNDKIRNLKLIIRRCHKCGQLTESEKEVEKCVKCGKSFLPLKYFEKVHCHEADKYEDLFSESDELCEEDLVKGIFVLW
jgi:rRNA maturation endonuclease Nob1